MHMMTWRALSISPSQRATLVGASKALTDVAAPYLASCFGRLFKVGWCKLKPVFKAPASSA